MSEKPTYDIHASRLAAADVARVKSAEALYTEAIAQENDTEDKARRLQQIMDKGFMGRLVARPERKKLRTELLDQQQISSDGSNGHRKAEVIAGKVVPISRISSPHYAAIMSRAKQGAAHNYSVNAGQYYDNAAIEANADFTNRGSNQEIITPAVLQEQADAAKQMTAEQSPEVVALVAPPKAS